MSGLYFGSMRYVDSRKIDPLHSAACYIYNLLPRLYQIAIIDMLQPSLVNLSRFTTFDYNACLVGPYAGKVCGWAPRWRSSDMTNAVTCIRFLPSSRSLSNHQSVKGAGVRYAPRFVDCYDQPKSNTVSTSTLDDQPHAWPK